MSTITATAAKATIPGEIRWYPEAASQSYLKGEFLYLDNAGRLNVCTSDYAGIAGIAEAPASGTTGAASPVTIAKRGQQFTMNVTNAGSSQITANAQVGRHYSLYVASNIHYCDIGDTGIQRFVVDAIAPDNTVGDTYGRVIVEVCKGYAQLDMTTS